MAAAHHHRLSRRADHFLYFSAETVTLLLRGQYAWGSAIIVAHLGGSLLMTVLGIYTFKWLQT